MRKQLNVYEWLGNCFDISGRFGWVSLFTKLGWKRERSVCEWCFKIYLERYQNWFANLKMQLSLLNQNTPANRNSFPFKRPLPLVWHLFNPNSTLTFKQPFPAPHLPNSHKDSISFYYLKLTNPNHFLPMRFTMITLPTAWFLSLTFKHLTKPWTPNGAKYILSLLQKKCMYSTQINNIMNFFIMIKM